MRGNSFLKKTALTTFFIIGMSFFAAMLGTSGIAGGPGYATDIQAGGHGAREIYEKVIRLHVIANSDTAEDQDLKMHVRDRIINELSGKLEDLDGIESSREYIIANTNLIQSIAEDEIKKRGKDYDVKAVFGQYQFPVKSYGFVTLPAGEYDALRVIIGNGKGSNWWCVLFPPLCFVDITKGETQADMRKRLEKVLTAEELAAIQTLSSPEQVPVKIRFKLVDWLHEASGKINRGMRIAFNRPW